MIKNKSRREFLGEASCASIGCISTLSSLLGLKLANQAAAANLNPGEDCKTLVCILLAGGNDTFNLLVRRDPQGYATYAESRSNLALGFESGGASTLTQLDQAPGGDGNTYGIHPACGALAEMFNGTGAFSGNRRLSFVSNVGTLVQPLTVAQFKDPNNRIPVPRSLFSHSDQINQWQTSLPQGRDELIGWAGRMADVLNSDFNTGQTSMSISLAGNNIYQVGRETLQFAITDRGALLPSGSASRLTGNTTSRKNFGIDSLITGTYNNMIQDALATQLNNSISAQGTFKEVFDNVDISAIPAPALATLQGSRLGRELLAAVRTIVGRQQLGLRRNTIFVQRGGWDHHGELLNAHNALLTDISTTFGAYQEALEALGLAQDVISYTASDFGRTLRSNGRGTDHAWGGNQMVWGGPIDGGKVFGTFPDLTLDGADDVGNGGRMLPTTSTDKFFSEMATWFGVSTADLDKVLPNIGNFSTEPDLGYIL